MWTFINVQGLVDIINMCACFLFFFYSCRYCYFGCKSKAIWTHFIWAAVAVTVNIYFILSFSLCSNAFSRRRRCYRCHSVCSLLVVCSGVNKSGCYVQVSHVGNGSCILRVCMWGVAFTFESGAFVRRATTQDLFEWVTIVTAAHWICKCKDFGRRVGND